MSCRQFEAHMEVDDSEQEYDEEVLFADDEASEANSEQTEHSKSDQQQSQSHRFGGSRSEQAPAELLRRFSHPQHSSQHPTSGPTRPPVQARPPTLHYPFDPHRTDPTGFSQYETPYAPSAASHTYGTTGTTQPAMLPGMLDPNDPSMMRGFNPTRTQLENPYATIQTVHGRPQQQYAGTRDAHFASSQQANRYGTLQSIPETPWQTDTTGRDASSQPGRIPTREPSNELAKVPPHAILKSNDPDDPYCKFCEKRIASTHWQSHIQSPQHIGNFERARQTTGFGERSLGPTGPTQRGKWCELCGVEILSKNWTQHKNSLTHLGKVRPGVPATPEPDPDPPKGKYRRCETCKTDITSSHWLQHTSSQKHQNLTAHGEQVAREQELDDEAMLRWDTRYCPVCDERVPNRAWERHINTALHVHQLCSHNGVACNNGCPFCQRQT